MVSTDAIGMGLNFPIKRVLFCEIEKFVPGKGQGFLKPSEVKQIAGRAGRFNQHEIGYFGFCSLLKEQRMKTDPVKFLEKSMTENYTYSKAVVGPSLMHYDLTNELLEEDLSLVQYLEEFKKMKLDTTLFEVMDLSVALNIARKISRYDFTLETEFKLIFAPINDINESYFWSLVNNLNKEEPLMFNFKFNFKDSPLQELENYLSKLDLYLYLCQRFDQDIEHFVSDHRQEIIQRITVLISTRKNY